MFKPFLTHDQYETCCRNICYAPSCMQRRLVATLLLVVRYVLVSKEESQSVLIWRRCRANPAILIISTTGITLLECSYCNNLTAMLPLSTVLTGEAVSATQETSSVLRKTILRLLNATRFQQVRFYLLYVLKFITLWGLILKNRCYSQSGGADFCQEKFKLYFLQNIIRQQIDKLCQAQSSLS